MLDGGVGGRVIGKGLDHKGGPRVLGSDDDGQKMDGIRQ